MIPVQNTNRNRNENEWKIRKTIEHTKKKNEREKIEKINKPKRKKSTAEKEKNRGK